MLAELGNRRFQQITVVGRKLDLHGLADGRALLLLLYFDLNARKAAGALADFLEDFRAFSVTLVFVVKLEKDSADAIEAAAAA